MILPGFFFYIDLFFGLIFLFNLFINVQLHKAFLGVDGDLLRRFDNLQSIRDPQDGRQRIATSQNGRMRGLSAYLSYESFDVNAV